MLQKMVSMGYYCRYYHLFLLQVVCRKQKPQIDGSLLNLLHIEGEEKPFQSYAGRRYHLFLRQVVWQKRKPKIDGLYLNVLHI